MVQPPYKDVSYVYFSYVGDFLVASRREGCSSGQKRIASAHWSVGIAGH